MYRYIIIHIFIVTFMWFQMGCDPISDVKIPKHEPRLVLNSYLIADENVLVDISYSVGILEEDEPENRLVKDASVELLENGNVIQNLIYLDTVPSVNSTDWGLYKSNFRPKADQTYQIRASHPVFGNIKGEVLMPPEPKVSNIRFELEAGQDGNGDPLSAIFFTLSDPPGTNYYEIFSSMRYERELISGVEIISRLGALGDRVGNGQFFQEYSRAPGLLDDNLFDGKSQEMALFFWSGSGQTRNGQPVPLDIIDVTLVVRSCDQHYYEYRSLIDLHLDIQNEESPIFPAEPINAYSNISGGYGILGAYNVFEQKVY
ncbi:MAG: DUF4249 domain-containing protein [Bacteroidia bacterium]